MKKKVIPIILKNERLYTTIKEVIEFSKYYKNFEFKISKKDELNNKDKLILITDDVLAMNDISYVSEFDQAIIINSIGNKLNTDQLNNQFILLNTPLSIRDLFERVAGSLDQIESQTARKLNFSKFVYDPGMRSLSNEDFFIRFTEKESQIFMCLMDNSNTHISKKSLLKKVWSYNEDIDTHTLETHIYSLRKKIEKNLLLKDLIVFEDKKGYFLNKKIL